MKKKSIKVTNNQVKQFEKALKKTFAIKYNIPQSTHKKIQQ